MPRASGESRDTNMSAPHGREDKQWLVIMGEHREIVEGDTYEHAVARFEASLIARGIERKGAAFMRGHTCEVDEEADGAQ